MSSIVCAAPLTFDAAVQTKLWPTLKANWVVWPLANFIAFRFLHQDMRILYANFIGVSNCHVQNPARMFALYKMFSILKNLTIKMHTNVERVSVMLQILWCAYVSLVFYNQVPKMAAAQ